MRTNNAHAAVRWSGLGLVGAPSAVASLLPQRAHTKTLTGLYTFDIYVYVRTLSIHAYDVYYNKHIECACCIMYVHVYHVRLRAGGGGDGGDCCSHMRFVMLLTDRRRCLFDMRANDEHGDDDADDDIRVRSAYAEPELTK